MTALPAYSASGSWPGRLVALGHRDGIIDVYKINEGNTFSRASRLSTGFSSAVRALDVSLSGLNVATADYYDGVVVYTNLQETLRLKVPNCENVVISEARNQVWGMTAKMCYGFDTVSGEKSVERCSRVTFDDKGTMWRIVEKNGSAYLQIPGENGNYNQIDTQSFGVIEISVKGEMAALTLGGGHALIACRSGWIMRLSSELIGGYAMRCASVGDDHVVLSCIDSNNSAFLWCFNKSDGTQVRRVDHGGGKGWTAWLKGSLNWFVEPRTIIYL